MDLAVLATELADPAYADVYPVNPFATVDRLNKADKTMVKERFVTARTVLAEVMGGSLTLDKLEAFCEGAVPPGAEVLHSAVCWAMRFMTAEPGIDVGSSVTRGMLDALANAGVITVDEAASLKNLANQSASRAEELFGAGARVSLQDVLDLLNA